jgi:hypothetical protein
LFCKEEQKKSNREKSRIRARVEHVFGHMTRSMKGLIPIPIKKCINFLVGIGMRDRRSRRNAKHFGGKAEQRFRRSRQFKTAWMQF